MTAEIARALRVRAATGEDLADAVIEHLRDHDLLLVLDNLEQLIDAGPRDRNPARRGAEAHRARHEPDPIAVGRGAGVSGATPDDPRCRSRDRDILAQLRVRRTVHPTSGGGAPWSADHRRGRARRGEDRRATGRVAAGVGAGFEPLARARPGVAGGTHRAAPPVAHRRRPGPPGAPAHAGVDDRVELRPAGPTRASACSLACRCSPADGPSRRPKPICGDDLDDLDALDGLAELVDASLVRRTQLADGTLRFTMLETIREYATDRLASGDEPERRRARAGALGVFPRPRGGGRTLPHQRASSHVAGDPRTGARQSAGRPRSCRSRSGRAGHRGRPSHRRCHLAVLAAAGAVAGGSRASRADARTTGGPAPGRGPCAGPGRVRQHRVLARRSGARLGSVSGSGRDRT